MCRCSCARTIRPDVIDYREVDTRSAQRNEQNNCRICGGNPDALLNAFKLGAQTAIFDTYADNLAATAAREAEHAARRNVVRWHE